MIGNQEFFSVGEVALLNALSKRTVWRAVASGALKVERINARVVRVHRDAAAAWRASWVFDPVTAKGLCRENCPDADGTIQGQNPRLNFAGNRQRRTSGGRGNGTNSHQLVSSLT
jgi:hypothetical protein